MTPVQLAQALHRWYGAGVGSFLLDEVRHTLDRMLPDLFGYYALQIGQLGAQSDLLASSRIRHHLCVDLLADGVNVLASPDALPFDQESLDLIVLFHTLDFTNEPHHILREIDRTLIPQGHVVIVGFNPLSIYGVWKVVLSWKRRVPWCGRFYTGARIKDWLSLLGFEPVMNDHLGYGPPINHRGLRQRLLFLERTGAFAIPYFGGVYVMLAQKRLATSTPIRTRWWSQQPAFLPGKLTEPTSRDAQRG